MYDGNVKQQTICTENISMVGFPSDTYLGEKNHMYT